MFERLKMKRAVKLPAKDRGDSDVKKGDRKIKEDSDSGLNRGDRQIMEDS
jgi:hypothetical protein